jgi:GNAT superfamily N-acetyltransferase
VEIVRVEPDQPGQLKQWLELPFRLYRDSPQWVPPLASDARLVFDRRRYPFYEHSEAAFFLALGAGRAVGRIAAIDHRNFNQFHRQATAFFYLFECENEPRAAEALFGAAFDWARQRGLERMIGPKGFTPLDGLGLLVKGYEHRPALSIPYNPPYYEKLVEAAGFAPLDEDVSGYLAASAELPAKLPELAAKVKERRGLQVPVFTSKSALRQLLPKLGDLYNRSLGANWDQVPITPREMALLAEQVLAIADPRLIQIVLKGDEPVGFAFAYPDPSAALQSTGGRLWPFGWARLLWELRRTTWVNINGMGILPEYQGLGAAALIFSELQQRLAGGRFAHIDVVQISTGNAKMQAALRRFGIDFYKVHRVYQRAL